MNAFLFPSRSYQRGILESVLSVSSLACLSVTCDSSEMACMNLSGFYMNIKYDVGIKHVFSNFSISSKMATILLKTYFALLHKNYRRLQFCLRCIIMLHFGLVSAHTVGFQIGLKKWPISSHF